MITNEEKKELIFFADKVANVHGSDHKEYIRINEIVKNIENTPLENSDFIELQELTNNYIVPEGACRAQTTLLTLLKKLDDK